MADTSLVFNIIAKDKTGAALGKASSGMQKFNKAAKVAATAVLAGGAVIAKQSVQLASTQAANYSKYEQVTKRSMDKAAETQARSLLLSRSDYADYFSQLSAMYQSNGIGVQKANKMAAESMKTAGDAAAFGNTTVGKAVEAQLGLLKGSGELWEQYSVSIKASDITARMKADGLDELTGKEKKAAEAATKHKLAQEASALFLGQAAKESGSLESAQQRMKATMDDLGASLGTVLLPYVESFAAKLQKVAEWAEKNQTIIKIVGGVVLGLAAAVWIVNGAVKAWTATTAAFNVVMSANPAVLVALAIIALIAVVVLIATKTTWFQDIWNKAWGAIKRAVSAVFGWVKSNWPLLLAILTGPFGLAVLAITKNWDRIKSGARSAVNWVKDKFGDLVGFVRGLPGKMRSALSRLFSFLPGLARGAINGVIGIFKNFRIPGFTIPIPFAPDISFGGASPFGGIPYLAKGGTINRSGLAVVGEAGPELVSLNRGAQVTPLTGRGAGAEVRVTIDLIGADADLRKRIQKITRVEGRGNVQVAFGRA